MFISFSAYNVIEGRNAKPKTKTEFLVNPSTLSNSTNNKTEKSVNQIDKVTNNEIAASNVINKTVTGCPI